MRFPTYKIHSFVSLFRNRMARSESWKERNELASTWGKCVAHNQTRLLRIGNLEFDRREISPWRQTVLHEIAYFNNRYEVYVNRWQKSYEQCSLALKRLRPKAPWGGYTLWQITALNEAGRYNVSIDRVRGSSRLDSSPYNWVAAYELNAWILRQKPIQPITEGTLWDLAFTSVKRDVFRGRKFNWQAAAQRNEDVFRWR
jgi:hypothetical protein